MSNPKLNVGCYNYARTRAFFDGETTFDGVDATFETTPIVSEIFQRMVQRRAYDVSELGLTFFLRTFDGDDPPFRAIPVFPTSVPATSIPKMIISTSTTFRCTIQVRIG